MGYQKTTKEELKAFKQIHPDFVETPKHPREEILKLGKHITDRMVHKIKPDDPEYYGLSLMADAEVANLVLKMKMRKSYTAADMASIAGISEVEAERILMKACHNGVIEYWMRNGRKEYELPPFVVGSGEYSCMHREELEAEPQRAYFFDRDTFLPLAGMTQMFPPGGAGVGMHVIPVEMEVENNSGAVDIERISYWLDKYEGKYAAMPCVCRMSMEYMGEGCGDDVEDWCICIGDLADYIVETNKGHWVDRSEVDRILKKSEEMGYVHQVSNMDGIGKVFVICNCNVNTCKALRTSQLFNTPNLSRSAYVARVQKENCVACGQCVEYCPAGAVKLGQKLCTKEGKEVQYPRHELPDDRKWGEDKWDLHYRDNNRINCYDTGTAPCKTACPAHISVQGYLKKAAKGEYREALALIKKENPFPAVCGRICNKRCEDACTRGTIDHAVSIDAVKKFIAQQDLKAETRYIPPIHQPSLRERFTDKIAIIGGGPAGLSCAFYLAEMGYYPTVFEKNEKPGGMMVYGIPSFKLEKNVVEAEIDILREMGVEFKCGVNVGTDISLKELRAQGFKAFYVAIGCQGARKAGIPGEDAKGIDYAVHFLKEASENQNQTMDGKVVVIGGGNVAIDVARTAHRFHARSVSMYALESRDTMPAAEDEIQEALEEQIEINNGWGPKEVVKDADGHVKEIILKKCLRTIDPKTKRFAPVYDESKTIRIACDFIIFSIGQSIEWNDLLDGMKVELGRGNGPVADTLTYETKEPDIFVGGDVYTGPKFVIDAIAAGKQGAYSLHRFVRKASLTIGRNRREFIELDKNNIRVTGYDTASHQEAGVNPDINIGTSFRDANLILTEEQVKIETARCLGCGASIVDPNKCIGCGVCTTKCKFDAVHLYRERPECSNVVRREQMYPEVGKYALKRMVKIVKRQITGKSVDGNGR